MTITQSSTRLVAVAAGVALALSLVFGAAIAPAHAAGLTSTQIQSILSLLSSFGADQATINNVNAALNGQATTGTGTGSTGGACPALSRDLQQGSSGADVMALQVFLNGSASTQVSASGAGSPGNETSTFGPATKAAVIKFQTQYGITPNAGYVGPKTRAQIASVCGGTSGNPGTGTGNGTGTGAVTVSAGSQPVNTLAVAGAARVPFTYFTLTNNSGSTVTINSVTVQRTGLGVDSNFSGVVLLDSTGLQIGNAKTFNSNHQVNVGDTGFTLNPGQSMTYTVAGNIAASSVAQSGQVVSLQVVAVNTSAAVGGSLPITGASQTINNTLTLGSVSTTTSSVVPPTGTSHTQQIGDTGVRFAGLRFTAGSAEDLKLYSIRWRQIGSASSVDLGNVVTVANGTTYPASIDSTGKYYTTVFPGGLLIPKGNNLDVYVQGDLVGSNSAGRTIQFTIDRATDVYFVGQLYGYGIAASGTGQPWFTGDSFTVQAGTASTISKSNAAADAAQNIAVNVPNQSLGGFVTNFLGEPVSISGLTLTVASSTSGTGTAIPLTNVSIKDDNGAVVAGPVDENAAGSLVFTDTITFPTGMHTYHVQGKVTTGVANNATFTLSTNPSSTWTNATGQTSGNSVSIAQGNFALNQMTVMGATSSITVSATPSAQNIVAGVTGLTFANIQLDATQSGEDVRFSSLPVVYNSTGSSPNDDLTGCQLFDGATALTTGSRVINSTGTSGSTLSFSFDNSLVVPKGTVKTVSVVCNVSSSATAGDTYSFGIAATGYTAQGVVSGVSVTPSIAAAVQGGIMTIASGSLTATAASTAVAQPSLALVSAGSTGVTIGSVKLHATNEALNLTKLGLTLANGTYGSKNAGAAGNTGHTGASDLVQVYIYNGTNIVGTASFTGSNTTATSTLSTPVMLAKDADTILTIKADLGQIGVSATGGIGDTVKVDPLNFEATGQSSGTTVKGGATAGVNGVQMMKSTPTVALASGACSGINCNGSNQVVKAFTVSASSAGPVSVQQLKFDIATSSANLTSISVQVYDQAGGVATSTFGSQACASGCTSNNPTLTFTGGPVIIPAGTAYTFKLIGTVTPGSTATNWSVVATLEGDNATMSNLGTSPQWIATTTAVADQNAESGFIWSDNATTTATGTDVDWFDGFQVNGLPSIGL